MSKHTYLLAVSAAALLSACASAPADTPVAEAAPVVETASVEEIVVVETSAPDLKSVLEAQPEAVQARYAYRHPAETLDFFRIEPGMTVVEALPGGGWYSKILLPYLGPEGELVGWHYPDGIWAEIVPNADEEQIARFIAMGDNWAAGTAEWGIENGASVSQYKMTAVPEEAYGTADAVLFIRALHNLRRTEEDHAYLSSTIKEAYALLKPGGVVGIVQHRAPETNSAGWADGNAGYLREEDVIAAFGAEGFILDASSEINANPNDRPTEEDVVWRLPPTRGGTEEGTPERAAVDAIGESDRMTLRFLKPT